MFWHFSLFVIMLFSAKIRCFRHSFEYFLHQIGPRSSMRPSDVLSQCALNAFQSFSCHIPRSQASIYFPFLSAKSRRVRQGLMALGCFSTMMCCVRVSWTLFCLVFLLNYFALRSSQLLVVFPFPPKLCIKSLKSITQLNKQSDYTF